MGKEFNHTNVTEYSAVKNEIALMKTNFVALEYTPTLENTAAQERATATAARTADKQKKKQQTGLVAKLMAATVVVTSGVVGVALATPTVDVRFDEIQATVNGVQYSVFVEDLDKPLVLALQNEFTNREVVLQEGVNVGEFNGLVSNMQYVLTVYYAEGLKTELAQKKVRTLKYEEEMIPAGVNSLEYTPAETAQGVFVFTPYYTNSNGVWTDMQVTLTDEYGVGSASVEVKESGVACEIPLADCGFFGSNGALQVWAFSTETQQRELLYQQAVSITQTQTQMLGVNFTAAGTDATAYCTVEFVDENGYWISDENGGILDVEVSALEEGRDGLQSAAIYQSGDRLAFIIYRANYGKSGRLLLQIYAYNAAGERLCIYAQEYDGIGEDFIPSASDWYEEPTE